MEISQIIQLSDWLDTNLEEVMPKYSELVNVLQNNSQQPIQQPVTQPLEDLSNTLIKMKTSELSALQVEVLEKMDTAKLIGKHGKIWINNCIKTTTYDPATTFHLIQQCQQKLEETQTLLREFHTSATNIGFQDIDDTDIAGFYLMNVIFRNEAKIRNVRDWKKAATDWELIMNGITTVGGKTPEDVQVVSAQNGSIIITLCAPLIVTKILATISKHIASIANDYLDFQKKREELQKSRMLSDVISKELKRQEDNRRENGRREILEAVQEIFPDTDPEQIAKLEKAVDRLLKFSENGGAVDFLLPPEIDKEAEDHDEDIDQVDDDMRELIQDYRSEIYKNKLLTYIENDNKIDQ